MFFLVTGHDKHSNSRSNSNNKDRDGATGSRHWSSRDDVDSGKESSRSSRKHPEESLQSTQDMDISPGDSTPTSEVNYSHGGPAQQPGPDPAAMGPVLLATALPRLISHPHIPTTPTTIQPESSPLNNPQSTPSMVPPPACVTTSNAPGPPHGPEGSTLLLGRPVVSGDNGVHSQPLAVDTNHLGPPVEGPPTPTHSEIVDCSKGKGNLRI